jgi:DNA-binding transcriptional regulator YhcF (GntR family)
MTFLTMKIKLDYHSSEPLYWQAVLEIKRLLVTKRLKPGDKLPSVRVLAEQLQINATTVRRIFAQLAKEGIVVQRHGSGVFITDGELPFSLEYVQKVMTRQAAVYLVEGLRLGLKFDELQKIIESQYKNLIQEQNTPYEPH